MKVFLFIRSLEGGGAERVMLRICQQLADAGVECHFLLYQDTLSYELPRGVPVHLLRSGRPGIVRYLEPWLRLRQLIEQEKPAALLAALPGPCVVAATTRLWLGDQAPRTVVAEHSFVRKNYRGLKKLAVLFSEFVAYRFADRVVGVSEGISDELRKFGLRPEQVVTVTNGVDVDEVRRLTAAPTDLAPSDARTFIAMGRLVPEKYYDTMLAAVARLKSEGEDVRLRIFGQGPEEPRLRNLSKQLAVDDRVAFEGFLANPFPAFRHAAGFVMSSRTEGFPCALLEAMAAGAAVIASDCQFGPRDLIGNDAYGLLFPVDDATALARHMRRLLNPAERVRLAALAAARSMDFSLESMGQRYRDLLLAA